MTVQLWIRLLIFMGLAAERGNLMRLYGWSIPYIWLLLTSIKTPLDTFLKVFVFIYLFLRILSARPGDNLLVRKVFFKKYFHFTSFPWYGTSILYQIHCHFFCIVIFMFEFIDFYKFFISFMK